MFDSQYRFYSYGFILNCLDCYCVAKSFALMAKMVIDIAECDVVYHYIVSDLHLS
jgi:hypothetical protein